eukprot:scaffold7583_cov118-Isochrysis_galbana.AAC.14
MSRKKERGECVYCVTPWGLSAPYEVLLVQCTGRFYPDEVISIRDCALRRTRSNHGPGGPAGSPAVAGRACRGSLEPYRVGECLVGRHDSGVAVERCALFGAVRAGSVLAPGLLCRRSVGTSQARGDEARKAQGGGERNLHLVFRGRWTMARGPSHTPFGGVRSLANTYIQAMWGQLGPSHHTTHTPTYRQGLSHHAH